jgi:hypothetical protein
MDGVEGAYRLRGKRAAGPVHDRGVGLVQQPAEDRARLGAEIQRSARSSLRSAAAAPAGITRPRAGYRSGRLSCVRHEDLFAVLDEAQVLAQPVLQLSNADSLHEVNVAT